MQRGSARNRNIDRWLGSPLLWVAARVRRRGIMPPRAAVRRVGVLTSTTIGDTLLASAAVQRVKAIWPQAELVFFCAAGNRAAVEMLPAVDRVSPTLSLTRPWQTIAAMRREALDVLVDFSAWQRITALICARSGARFCAGVTRADQPRGEAQDLTVQHRGDRHESENFAALVDALEAAAGAPHTQAELRLREDVLDTPLDPYWQDAVVFHCWATGANAHLREWPEERWVELAALLREHWPEMKLVLTAGPGDMPRAESLAARLNAEVFRPDRGGAKGDCVAPSQIPAGDQRKYGNDASRRDTESEDDRDERPNERLSLGTARHAGDRAAGVGSGLRIPGPGVGISGPRRAGVHAPDFRRERAVCSDNLPALNGPLRCVVALLLEARLVVSVNTGTMHLAAIAGGSVVGLNGPNRDARWGPRGPHAFAVDSSGGGCGYLDLGWEFGREPAGRTTCMERISVEQVLAAIQAALMQPKSDASRSPARRKRR